MSKFKKRGTNRTPNRKKTAPVLNTFKQGHQETVAINQSKVLNANEGKKVAYDENLLERVCTQWQFGDWDSLVKLQRDMIEHHPERAKLTLLVAAGHQQVGDMITARKLVLLAREWGCDKKLISRVLVAGVYNTLGKASAIRGQQNKALELFELAVVMAKVGPEARLFVPARIQSQIDALQLKAPDSDFAMLIKAYIENYRSIQNNHIKIDFDIQNCKFLDYPKNINNITINNRPVVTRHIEYGSHEFDFFLRPDSIGDVGVIKQIFEEKQYEFGWFPQGKLIYDFHKQIIGTGKYPLIIDAGANIGASCIYFDIKFKKSIILAIEPDVDNCELIRINCANKDILLFQGALADKKRVMYFQDPGESDWGFRVGETGLYEVNCLGISNILDIFDERSYCPLILKIDIEGGESLVFKGNCNWLKRIPMIIIELHDWMLPNQYSSSNFLNAITRYSFEVISHGENIMCFNQRILNKNKTY